MIKLRFQNDKRNPVQVRWVKIWQLQPNLWVFGVDSPDETLALQAQTDGIVIYSPYGNGSPVRVVAEDEILKSARFFTTIDRHEGSDHKYFLVKWFCPDEEWTAAAEDSAMATGLKWIESGEWKTSTVASHA
ncbi:MAG: hypothetical protein EBU08_22215 [Micrococcales bacterium]|nr:hypothetical protein [Micrococcales bacterium]